MSVYRFLPLENTDTLQYVQSPICGNYGESCAIVEENSLLKGSLLFQAALSVASDGDQVLFICPAPMEQRPYHVSGMPEPSHLVLQCIKMVYIDKPSDLLQYLCEFHTKESFPAAIMIDDVQYYVSHLSEDQSKEAALVKLFAILEDTVAFISQKRGDVCHRTVSLLSGACSQKFIKRYFRELWHLSCGEKEGDYFLTSGDVPAFRALLHLNKEEEIVLNEVYRLSAENASAAQ